MPNPLDFKDLLEWLNDEPTGKRRSYSLYFSEALFGEFKKYCRSKNPSQVMEFLMKAFINAAKEQEAKRAKKKG
jgi:hypothetical protein